MILADTSIWIDHLRTPMSQLANLVSTGQVLMHFRSDITLTQNGDSGDSQVIWKVEGKEYLPGKGRHWRTHADGRVRLAKAD